MSVDVLAQAPPPQTPQDLPPEIEGQMANWVSIGLGFVAITTFVFVVWALAEMASARQHGREHPQIIDRLLTLAVIGCVSSSIGSIVSLVYITNS